MLDRQAYRVGQKVTLIITTIIIFGAACIYVQRSV